MGRGRRSAVCALKSAECVTKSGGLSPTAHSCSISKAGFLPVCQAPSRGGWRGGRGKNRLAQCPGGGHHAGMAFQLNGHVALVTGSSTGLGKSVALSLARAGARVAMNYAGNKERAEKSFAELQAVNPESVLVRADVSDPDSVAALVAEIEAKLGVIDIIVANATPPQPQKPIEEYDWAFYQQMIDFFIKSPYLLTRATLAQMKERKWGRIINIASEVFQCGVGNFSAYVAAKGGQIGWSRSMATELAPFGITVNCVNPGWIPVERHENDPQEQKDGYFKTIPMGRWGVPKDVGDAVVYFASEEAGFITGQTLCVNGGRTPW